MQRLALILGLGALVAAPMAFAAPAQVGSWTQACQSGQSIKSLTGGAIACYTPATGASNESASPVLAVSDCESIDVFLYSDYDGDGNTCNVDWAIQGCPPGASALDDAHKNVACADLPSVDPLSGTTSTSNVDAQVNLSGADGVRVVGQAAGVNIDSCRVTVKCAAPAPK